MLISEKLSFQEKNASTWHLAGEWKQRELLENIVPSN